MEGKATEIASGLNGSVFIVRKETLYIFDNNAYDWQEMVMDKPVFSKIGITPND